jgi:uncharacterized protein (TIGR03067 family)
MKTLLLCALLALLVHTTVAEQKSTPPPFPGWATKMSTPAVGTPSPGARATSENSELTGKWEGYVTMGDGPSQRRMNITLKIAADKITSSGAGGAGEGTYHIAPGNGDFQNIDSTGTAGMYRGKLYDGIFTLEGNTLKWCAGDPGKGRPTALRTNPQAGHFLMVLTRKQ